MGKFKFSYKRFAVTVMVGAILAATTATAAFSYAWFTNHNNVTNNDLQGSTAGAYFARGDGSKDKPYVINQPIHLYNLAWLQYIGAFDGKEPYFIIEKDLKMDGWTLPPIGTTDHPFKGHLDGFDKTHCQNQTSTAKISNLTISNSFGDFDRHPSSVTTFTSPEITGLFGVIKKFTTTDVPSVQNLYIDNLTVTSKTDNALTGLVAGYVDGQLEGIGINNSKLDIKNGTSKLDGYDNISKYTSVGYCTKDYEPSYVKTNTTMYTPAQAGTASFNPTGSIGGPGTDWGGSIDMFSLTKRITYIVNDSMTIDTFQIIYEPKSEPKRYNLGKVRFSTRPSTNPIYLTKNAGITLRNNTYLPLNVNLEQEFQGSEIRTNFKIDNKYAAVAATTSYFKDHTVEPLLNNTGYLTASDTGSDQIQFNVMETSGTNGISNSLGGSTYDPEKIALLYCDSNGSLSKIEDGDNLTKNTEIKNIDISKIDSSRLMRYSEIKQNIGSMINESYFYNLRWMKHELPSLTNAVEAKNISMGKYKNTKINLIAPGIDFYVENKGFITCLLTPYPNGGNGNSLFSLYKVSRNDNGSNPTLEKVSNGVPENVKFDLTHAILYLEIEVEAGEYFITNPESGSTSASFMYLDIGANASGSTGKKVDRTKIYEVFEQINEEFKYPTGVEIVNFANGGVDAKKKFAVAIGKTYFGQAVTLKYSGGDNAEISVTSDVTNGTGLAYLDTGLKITSGSTVLTEPQIKGVITHTRTQRLTYFDYYREGDTNAQTEALYTNVLRFYKTHTVDAKGNVTDTSDRLSDYRFKKVEDEWTDLGTKNLKIYNDETGEEMKMLPEIAAPESFNEKTNVFTLQTTDPTIQFINTDWIQTGLYSDEGNPARHTFKPKGYKFTMNYTKDGASTSLKDNQYSTSTTPADYSVSINNGNALPKA